MEVAQLIEIALANSDEGRVQIAALEPAEIGLEAVGALSQLIAELVDNALAFSGPRDRVRIMGLHDQGDYLISISDRGVGIPEQLMSELNRVLESAQTVSTEPRPGIAVVARLGARHGIDVRLVPGAPGTTARVTVPGRLISEPPPERKTPVDHRLPSRQFPSDEVILSSDEEETTVDLTRFDREHRVGSGVVAMSDELRREAEAFLDRVFAPLRDNPGVVVRPPSRHRSTGNGQDHPAADDSADGLESAGTVTKLRVRVPGENFSLIQDEPSTIAAEAAIDIRSALDSYERGRRSAEDTGEDA